MSRITRIALASLLSCAILAPAAPQAAFCDSMAAELSIAPLEDDCTESEGDGLEDIERDATTGRVANSWRFQDGQRIAPQADARASKLLTWSYKNGTYTFSNGIKDSRATAIGIDVSEWQEDIDWAKVKKSGIDYAIIRCGYGGDHTYQDDKYFFQNVEGCREAGIPFGVYIYSYSDSTTVAKSEAKHVLRLLRAANIKPSELSYPVYFDLEEQDPKTGKPYASNTDLGKFYTTFKKALEAEGYPVGVYANLNWWNNYLTDDAFHGCDRWVAQYNIRCDYEGDYTMWQLTSSGKVPGVNGPTDMNLSYDTRVFGRLEQTADGLRFKQPDGTYLVDSWLDWDGHRYHFDVDGYASTGLTEIDGKQYYFGNDAKQHLGWLSLSDGSRMYFARDTKGSAAKGWWSISGKRFYFDPANCRTLKGEALIGGKYYYFEKGGSAKVGWHTWADGSRSYFSKDNKGAASKAWWTISGKRYYFSPETRRTMKNGVWISDKYYFFNQDGSVKTGWHTWSDGRRSYFLPSQKGSAAKGWWTLSGKRYYFEGSTRKTYSGYKSIGGKYYSFAKTGNLLYGWHRTTDGARLYFSRDNKGAAAKGWWTLSGKRYYFDPSSYRAVSGVRIINGVSYQFNSDGVLIKQL